MRTVDGPDGQRSRQYVHRWVVAAVHGWPAIEGKVVMHKCDNRKCYRYDHLQIGTIADNNADMHAKGRAGHGPGRGHITHCPQGHAYNEANTQIVSGKWRRCAQCHRDRERARRKAQA